MEADSQSEERADRLMGSIDDLGLIPVLARDPNDPCVRHQRRDVVDLASVSGVKFREECGHAHRGEHAADIGSVPDAIDLERDVGSGGGSTQLSVPDRRLRRHNVVVQLTQRSRTGYPYPNTPR